MKFNRSMLKCERVYRKKSQTEMGKVLGVSRETYNRKENGHHAITVEELGQLLEYLEVPTSEYGKYFY